MSQVLVLGGGFGGLVAAERLAQRLGPEHHVTLMSRGGRFLFYPALVRLAFGKCEPDDISFNLREALADRRVHRSTPSLPLNIPPLNAPARGHGSCTPTVCTKGCPSNQPLAVEV